MFLVEVHSFMNFPWIQWFPFFSKQIDEFFFVQSTSHCDVNLLSRIFDKNFVKATFLLKNWLFHGKFFVDVHTYWCQTLFVENFSFSTMNLWLFSPDKFCNFSVKSLFFSANFTFPWIQWFSPLPFLYVQPISHLYSFLEPINCEDTLNCMWIRLIPRSWNQRFYVELKNFFHEKKLITFSTLRTF